jgi:elongation factor 1 alpha-like protein
LVCGTIAGKDRLRVCPSSEVAAVKSLEAGDEARRESGGALIAGVDNLPVSLGLVDIPETLVIAPGDVLCDPAAVVPIVSRFEARILVLDPPMPLVQGVQVELHMSGLNEAAVISKLLESVDAKSGPSRPSGDASTKPKRLRMLAKGTSAIVEIRVCRRICLELGADVKALGRFALRAQGNTIAAGVVTRLLDSDQSKRVTVQ